MPWVGIIIVTLFYLIMLEGNSESSSHSSSTPRAAGMKEEQTAHREGINIRKLGDKQELWDSRIYIYELKWSGSVSGLSQSFFMAILGFFCREPTVVDAVENTGVSDLSDRWWSMQNYAARVSHSMKTGFLITACWNTNRATLKHLSMKLHPSSF